MDNDLYEDIGILLLPPEVYPIVGRILLVVWVLSLITSMFATIAFCLSQTAEGMFVLIAEQKLDYHAIFAIAFAFFAQCMLLVVQLAVGQVHATLARQHIESVNISKKMIRKAKIRRLSLDVLSYCLLTFNYIACAVAFRDFGDWQSAGFCLLLFVCNFYFGMFGVQFLWLQKSSNTN